jgi:hypothetical protein
MPQRHNKKEKPMLVVMFATAMMLAMIVSTAVGLHNEALRAKAFSKSAPVFGPARIGR